MNRYKKAFAKKNAFIPFAVVGDPDLKTSEQIIRAMIDSGADALELGVAFTDPIADGPTIQKADDRVLRRHIKLNDIFNLIKRIRKYNNEIPIGLLTYYNIIYQRGIEKFFRDAKAAGVDGVLAADLPIEEANDAVKAAKKAKIDPIFIVSPTTTANRLKKILKSARGFIYVVSLLGVTGTRNKVNPAVYKLLKFVRPKTRLPLAVGFGISKPEHVRTILSTGADGVIVGSAIVKIIEKNLGNKRKMTGGISSYVKKMKAATIQNP
ncbi:MAG TPA: tryptophan synthase subunit alpha [Candidatus Nanoarchaeia archaeon]|nr:tryptophan synthase subunit alpha [Candidatus Nanoarchaeia archaeon]